MRKLTVKTQRKNELIDITSEIKGIIHEENMKGGLCIIFCPHTTAGVTVNESFDPSVKTDMVFSLNKISPDYEEFRHSEGNSDAHIKSSLMGSSINLIVHQGRLMIGQWQGVYFTEFDGPRTREVWIKIIKD